MTRVIDGLASRVRVSRAESRLETELDLVTSRCELVLVTTLLSELFLSTFDFGVVAVLRLMFDFDSCLFRTD